MRYLYLDEVLLLHRQLLAQSGGMSGVRDLNSPESALAQPRRNCEMQFTVETEQEQDGRWIGEITELFGVLAYGKTREEAIARAQALALRVLADRLEHGEELPEVAQLFSVV